MINFQSLDHKHHKLLILEQNVPDFPSIAVMRNNFPIPLTIQDWCGDNQSLKVRDSSNLYSLIHPEILNRNKFISDKNGKLKLSDFTLRHQNHTSVESPIYLILNGEPITIKQFYKRIYNLAPDGQNVAESFESNYYGANRQDIDGSGQSTDEIQFLEEQFPFSYHPKNIKIKALPHLNILRYYSLSRSDAVVATKDYNVQKNKLKWQQRGVFRLPMQMLTKSETETVLIVENPLIADYLQSHDICALPLPSEDELSYYDYPSLLADKNVILCLRNLGQSFSFSIYPFASLLLSNDITLFKSNLRDVFSNTSIAKWTYDHNPEDLTKKLKTNSSSLEASDIPNRKDYNESHSDYEKISFNPAQDVQKSSLIYAYEKDKTILSNPIRTIDNSKLYKMEYLTPSHNSEVQGLLDQDMVDHIKRGEFSEPASLYSFLRSFIKRFLYFKHHQVFDVLTAWVMGSYVFKLFQAYPYLHFMGERGTGKTTILEILSQLSFNGKHLTKATTSSLIHQVHHHSSTLCIDEFEDYSSKRKSEDDLSRFLNGGYHYKGSYEKRSKNGNTTLNTYSPKAFGGTGDIFINTLKSRSIQIKTFKKPKSIPKDQFVEFDNQIARDIRLIQLSSFALGLTNTSTLLNTVSNIPTDIRLPISNVKLDNRKLQLAKPLLTIAELIDNQEARHNILEGLDLCWVDAASNQSQLLDTVKEILAKFLKIQEPVKEDTVYLKFITKDFLVCDIKQKYEKDYDKLRTVRKLNEFLEYHFDIKRKNEHVPSLNGTESLYLIPRGLADELQEQ